MFNMQAGEYWLYLGEAFRVKAGFNVDDDGSVTIPITWVKSRNTEMHDTRALARAFALGELHRCEHDVVVSSEWGWRICAACEHPLGGWYCPDSPGRDHSCYYGGDEFCVFCGQPGERK